MKERFCKERDFPYFKKKHDFEFLKDPVVLPETGEVRVSPQLWKMIVDQLEYFANEQNR